MNCKTISAIASESCLFSATCKLSLEFQTRRARSGLSCPQVQMTSEDRDPTTVMRYDHYRYNLDLKNKRAEDL